MPRAKKNEDTQIAATAENENGNNIADFELSAEIVVGKLTSNAKELAEKIRNELKKFTVDRYIGNPAAAKADKALLTKVKDAISDKRKKVSAEWNKPLDALLDEMKSLEKEVSECYDNLNDVVKQAENAEKENKRKEIEGYWHTLGITIIPLEKIFNPKWLNKTFSMNDVMKEVEAKVEKITGELATLRSMKDEDSETLQSFYLETLDLNATLEKGNQLKANRAALKAEEERRQREEAEKAKREAAVVNATKTPVLTENSEIEAEFAEKPQNLGAILPKNAESVQNQTENATTDLGVVFPTEAELAQYLAKAGTANLERKESYRLEVSGTVRQLVALRLLIDKNGLHYKKI